jgi:HK97 family phage major capsid protein
MPMPSATWDMPTQSGVTVARIQGENATMSEAQFATGKLTFSAKKLSQFAIVPSEVDEDTAPAIMAIIRDDVAQAQERAVETATLNGDVTGTHQDADVTASDDAQKAWNGLRKLAIANTANGSTVNFAGALTDANLRLMRQRMKLFGVDPSNLLWIMDSQIYNSFMGLTDVTTLEKYGTQATILTGELSKYAGIPVYVSGHAKPLLNASGVVDAVGANNTKGSVVLVNRSRFFYGVRRAIRIRLVQDLPSHDRWLLHSSQRIDYKGLAQSASEVSVVYGINVTI